MELVISQKSIKFYGQVKDIKSIFAGYPKNLTLEQFIKLNLH